MRASAGHNQPCLNCVNCTRRTDSPKSMARARLLCMPPLQLRQRRARTIERRMRASAMPGEFGEDESVPWSCVDGPWRSRKGPMNCGPAPDTKSRFQFWECYMLRRRNSKNVLLYEQRMQHDFSTANPGWGHSSSPCNLMLASAGTPKWRQ